MERSRWNEWDGLWTEENKNETWSMKCGLKEMRWNINNKVWTEENEMKYEQGNEMKHEKWGRYVM